MTSVAITVHVDQPVRIMAGGIGASWHAISSGPRQGAGSAWGGNPEPERLSGWQQLSDHANWLGLDWIRVELEHRSYQPDRDRFDFDSHDMRAVYRILDHCQRSGVEVMLQQMWSNVEWNAIPGCDPLHSAPRDIDAFANGFAEMARHLVQTRGYACIRWFCITNEPGEPFSWWQGGGNQPMPITQGLRAVRRELDRRGVHVGLMGPDRTNLPECRPAEIDYDDVLAAYDIHTYTERFGHFALGESEAEKRLVGRSNWAHRLGKPFFLGEFGAMDYGWYGSNPSCGGFLASLKNIEVVIRGLHCGVDGFNRWSFVNRGDLDGQWQLVDSWDIEHDCFVDRVLPHPNSYFIYGLLTRFLPARSKLLRVDFEGLAGGWQQYVLPAAVQAPDGSLRLFVLNNTEEPVNATITIAGSECSPRLHRYRVDESCRDRRDVRLDCSEVLSLTPVPTTQDLLPGLSFTVYSTPRLDHGQPAMPTIRLD